MRYAHYGVQGFFDSYPNHDVCYETYDGIIHGSPEVAKKWVEMHANKTVTVHNRVKDVPAEVTGKGKGKGKVGGKGKTTDAAGAEGGAAGADGGTPNEGAGGEPPAAGDSEGKDPVQDGSTENKTTPTE